MDRLPVLASGFGVDKVLTVLQLENGTGSNQADAVVDVLQEWNITDRVVAKSFNTTMSNTVHIFGASTFI